MNNTGDLIDYLLTHHKKDLSIQTLTKGEILFVEMDCSNNLYILTNGVVELYKITNCLDERVLFLLKGPSILNEEVLFSTLCENSTSARTCIDSEILKIPKHIFLNIMRDSFDIIDVVNRSLNNKLKRCYRQLKNSGTNITINKKVASKLWKLAHDYGVETEKGLLIQFNLSITLLAKMIGTKRETVSRCIKNLKKEGILKYDEGQFIVVDIDSLALIYNGECDV